MVKSREAGDDVSAAEKIELKPIGFVKTKAVGKEVRDRSNVSEIILREDLAEALKGIEDFSHLFVIFWMHEISKEERRTMKVHPRGRGDLPLLGVFATRTPSRPNPIGLTLVELLEVEGNVVTVQGLDAFDGTPVLDIKAFDHWDSAQDARVPDWWTKLEKERSEKHKGSR
jgi:tRNA-Thr(GGU) m(6)t(6)A37 methyltransferase TsaA